MHLRSLRELDNTEGTVQLYNQSHQDRLVLHPVANPNDPNDPLRWPRLKKHVCFANVCAFAFLTNFGISGLAPAYYLLSQEYGKTSTEISQLLEYPILVLGAFNFFWVPLANFFGKRPVFVFASLLLALTQIWGALAQSFESLLWSSIIAAFAGSSTEALGAAAVNDLYFLHERSTLMSFYVICIASGNSLGPLICGFITTGVGWRWYKWLACVLSAINFACVVLFVPETRYSREQQSSSNPSTPSEAVLENAEKTPVIASTPAELHPIQEVKKRTWLQELSLWSGTPKDTNLFKLILRPFPLIVYPAVLLACLGYTVSLAWVVMINAVNPFILQAPPYNWSPAIDGLINIPGFLGNAIGCLLGGWVVDRYSAWRSRKNHGVFQSETRLHLLIIPALVVPAGCLVFGYGVAETLNWTSL